MVSCRIVVLFHFTFAIAIAHEHHAHIDLAPWCRGPNLFQLPSDDDHCLRVNKSPPISWNSMEGQCKKELESPNPNYTVEGFHYPRFENRESQDELAAIGRQWFDARNEAHGVLKFWIGLVRQNEAEENEQRLNDTEWHDPEKWMWTKEKDDASQHPTTLYKSHGDTIKWMERGDDVNRSPKSYCALAYLNTEDGSMRLGDFPCNAPPTGDQHVICLVHFVAISAENPAKNPATESSADENDDWKYALIGAGGGGLLIVIVGVSILVIVLRRRRRRRMRSVTQHAVRSGPNRSSVASNGSDKRKRNRRRKGRRLRRYDNIGSDSDDSSSERSWEDDDPFARRRKPKVSSRRPIDRSSHKNKPKVESKRKTKQQHHQLPIGSLNKTVINVASMKSASSIGNASKTVPSIKRATPGSKKQSISSVRKSTMSQK